MGRLRERLVDERAGTLLALARATPALVVARRGGFSPPRGGDVVVAAIDGALGGIPSAADLLPFATGAFAAVIDTTRPEEPADHGPLVRELARVCRPGGTVAAVACAGLAVTAGPRTLTVLEDCLDAAGCDVVQIVPFDVLGLFSPWRLGLGARRERVLAELETHLASAAVCDAVRLIEERVVAGLDPTQAGRAVVLARRRDDGEAIPEPVPAVTPRAALARPAAAAEALRLMQDDAVIRFAAFLDAEFLARPGASFDLLAYIERIGAIAGGELRPRLWRWPGLEAYRYLGALAHRLALGTIAALGEGAGPDALLPATLEYDLVETFNALLEPGGDGRWSG